MLMPEENPSVENTTPEPVTKINPSNSQSKKSNSMLIWGFVTILVLIALGVGGYFVLANKSTDQLNNNHTITTSPTITKTLSPSPTASYTIIDMDVTHWKTYTLPTLKMEFKLPLEISNYVGNITETTNQGGISGNTYRAKFDKPISANGSQDTNFIGTTSISFSEGREASFLDLIGYSVSKGVYTTKISTNDKGVLEFKSFTIPSESIIGEITNSNGLQILKVRRVESKEGLPVPPWLSTNTGALININNANYPGITVQIDLSGNLTEKVFDQILSTFKSTK